MYLCLCHVFTSKTKKDQRFKPLYRELSEVRPEHPLTLDSLVLLAATVEHFH